MKRKPGPVASRLPRRYKRGGKEIGSFFIRIKGKDVNLWTQDAELARQRAKAAFAGNRFNADGEARSAAQVVVESLTGTESATTPPVVEPSPVTAPDLTQAAAPPPAVHPGPAPAAALPPVGGGAPPPAAGPVKPDGYIPPPDGWADAVRGAASSAGGGAAAAEEPDEEAFSPDMIEDILDQAAEVVVGAQIALQSYVAAKGWVGVKVKTADVPMEAKGRTVGKKFWKKAFKKLVARYMPDLDLPDWLVAPVMVAALTLPVQLFGEGAEIIPDDAQGDEKQQAEARAA